MSRFFVIASNSFSGAHLVDLLLEDPSHEVVGMARSEKSDLFLPYRKRKDPKFKNHILNVNSEFEKIIVLLDKFEPEYVINFAAQGEVATSWKYPEQWFQTNAVAVSRLANFLKDRKYLKRYVHISTPEVYGTCEGNVTESAPLNPSTPYAASKAAGDLFLMTLVKQYQFPLVMIRSTNVYGPHQQLYRIIPRTIIFLKQGKTIPLHGGGRAYKSYIHIRDVCEGIYLATLKGRLGETYHFSPKEDISIRDLVNATCARMEKDFKKSVEIVAERPGQDARYIIDSSKASREFGWKPKISLEEGLGEMIFWIERDWTRIVKEPLEYVYQP